MGEMWVEELGSSTPIRASLMAQWQRIHLQCRRRRRLGSITGGEDSLRVGMATLSSILTWEIPWTEEPGGL